jgi:hypothetical protein
MAAPNMSSFNSDSQDENVAMASRTCPQHSSLGTSNAPLPQWLLTKSVMQSLKTYRLIIKLNNHNDPQRTDLEWDIDMESNHPAGLPPVVYPSWQWPRRCQARIVVLDKILPTPRDQYKFLIDTKGVQQLRNGFDNQTYIVDCLMAIGARDSGIDSETVQFWNRLKYRDIETIQMAVEERCGNLGFETAFITGPAHKDFVDPFGDRLLAQGSLTRNEPFNTLNVSEAKEAGLVVNEIEVDSESDPLILKV